MKLQIDNFLKELSKEGKSKSTLYTYKIALNQFLKSFQDTNDYQDIDKVTPIDIKEYKQYLQVTLERKPATINKALVILKGFFAWAAELGIININPARKVKLVEQQSLAPKWLDRNEQNRLLRTIELEKGLFKQFRDKAMVLLMLMAGLRVEELTRLMLSDITIGGRSGNVIVRRGKRDKYREIPLNKDIRYALTEYLEQRSAHKYKDSPKLFVSERSPKITTRALQHLMKEYAYKAKIEGLTCHALRHTFCHNLIVAGEGIEKVAMLAGHKSIETTRIYTIPGEKELQSAVEKLAEDE